MRVVCDTNVLVSAIFFGGNARRIIRLVSESRIEGYLSLEICRESEEVLLRPKFGLHAEQVHGIMELVRETFFLVSPSERIAAVPDDPDDNIILEAAVAATADAVITGDQHLLVLEKYRGIRILSPAGFLGRWEAE